MPFESIYVTYFAQFQKDCLVKMKSCLLLCLTLFLISTVSAQLDLEETFISEDESFEFMYPDGWEVNAEGYEDSGFVLLSGEIDETDVLMGFVGSAYLNSWAEDVDNLDDIVATLTDNFAFGDATELEIDGRSAIETNFAFDDTSGTAIILELADDSFGMVLIITDNEFEEIESDILPIIATFKGLDSEPSVSQLNDYNSDDWRDVIAKLESEGLIASGGILIFNEPQAFFEGVGSWFTPLSQNSSIRDVVVAAELDFTSDSQTSELCSLLARIVPEPMSNSISTYLEIGVDNRGRVYWVDREGEDVTSDVSRFSINLDEQHHFLFIALDNYLTIYVDGTLVFDKVSIQSRSGYFGIALLGYGENSRCSGHNIWAYNAPIFVEGLCEVTSANTVNKRTGPGTNYDRIGTLSGGVRVAAQRQSRDASGYMWYELQDRSWVREDVINLLGDCSNLPELD